MTKGRRLILVQHELVSRELCIIEYWSAVSEQEVVFPVILLVLGRNKESIGKPSLQTTEWHAGFQERLT